MTPILVCIGNPPYDREARDPAQYDGAKRKGGWVRYGNGNGAANGNGKKNGNGNGVDGKPILDDFLAPVRAAGGGVHLVNLYNDYVYFWRWALWKVFEGVGGGDGGIVTFITASSYLRGPAFAGMRRKMREAFDDLWIIDLEGDNLGPRKTENVFAIQTPVAIAIGVRGVEPNPGEPAKVWKIRLTGSAKEKLARLNEIQTFASVDWRICASSGCRASRAGGIHGMCKLCKGLPVARAAALLYDRRKAAFGGEGANAYGRDRLGRRVGARAATPH